MNDERRNDKAVKTMYPRNKILNSLVVQLRNTKELSLNTLKYST